MVIGHLDADDAHHAAAAQLVDEVIAVEPLVVSVITVTEVLVGVERGHHARARAEAFFGDVNVVDVDAAVARRAAELLAAAPSRKFRTPDALILASAEIHGAERAVTADLRWNDVRGVRVAIDQLA